MFLIFGWGTTTRKVYKTLLKIDLCPICKHEDKNYVFIREMTWFTLFFIPVIPYSIKHFLLCSNCANGFGLKDKRQIEEIKQVLKNPAGTSAQPHVKVGKRLDSF